jgi:hypothetical protein
LISNIICAALNPDLAVVNMYGASKCGKFSARLLCWPKVFGKIAKGVRVLTEHQQCSEL